MQRFPHSLCLAAFVAIAIISSGKAAHAQSYQPSRPTISPYLYLTKPQQGPLPNYQTYVQPLKNQQQTNQVQQNQITRIQQTQQQLLQQPLIDNADVAPTGIGSTYNSLSHYYPGAGGANGKSGRKR